MDRSTSLNSFSLCVATAALLTLGACGGGGKDNASASAAAASTSTSCSPTTTTNTSTSGIVTVTITPCPAASAPSTTASSPSTTASSPSTTASSPSTTASSPSTTASSPSTTASAPTSVATAASGPYGLWNGSTSTSRNLYGLVLPDGNYYLFYTGVGTSAFSGILIGHGTATPGPSAGTGSFVAADPDAWDYSLEGNGAQSATMPNTQYAAGAALSGTLHYAASDVTFQAAYDSRYGTAPTLASLAGTFTGNAASLTTGVGSASLVFGTNGTITGTAANCAITGTATPRTDGNAFNIALNFGPAPCLLPGQTLTGAAFYSVAIKQILLAAPTGDRSDGFLVIATKP